MIVSARRSRCSACRQVAALRVEGSQGSERDRDLVVVGTKGAFEDGECCVQEGARFVVAAQVGEDRGQCCAVGGGVGVVGPERGVADLDRPSGCCLSVGGASGGVGETADVVEHGGELGIVGSEMRDQHGACGRVQLRGFVEAAGVLQQHGEVVADPGRGQIVGGQVSLGDGQRPPVELFGGGGVAGSATAAGLLLQHHDATNMLHLSAPRQFADGDCWALPSAEPWTDGSADSSVIEQQQLVVVLAGKGECRCGRGERRGDHGRANA